MHLVLQWSLYFKRPTQPEKYGLKLQVILKLNDTYTQNIRDMSLMVGLKMQGVVKWRDLKP